MEEHGQTAADLLATIEKLQKRISELEVSEDERMRAEIALWEGEERYRTLFERIPLGIYRTTPDEQIIDANQTFMQMLRYPDKDSILNVRVSDLYAEAEDREREIQILESKGLVQGFRVELRCYDGSTIWVRDFCRSVRNSDGKLLYYEGSLEDITKRKQTEDALAVALEEKEALLNELQHRVKNNLTMIGGLVRLEVKNVSDDNSRNILENIGDRINSIANLYTILFHSGSSKEVRLDRYVQDIVADLTKAYIHDEMNITMQVDCDPIVYDAKSGVPFGLVLNEILTNTLKYAFPDKSSGTIDIQLKQIDQRVHLDIRDNGIGLPREFNLERSPGMGMRLITMLTGQLYGEVTVDVEKNEGTHFHVEVPLHQTD